MDIVGMLLQKGQLQKDELGKIEVLDHSAYAAIKRDKILKTLPTYKRRKNKEQEGLKWKYLIKPRCLSSIDINLHGFYIFQLIPKLPCTA